MTPPPWYITDHAIDCYLHLASVALGADVADSDENAERIERELEELSAAASFKRRDELGRELWRSSRRRGAGLRWVVDPRLYNGSALPRVVWVGYGRPPRTLFTPEPNSAARR